MAADSEHALRRDEIRAIATRIFATRGVASTTMRDIAAETGLLAGSLYYYIESKDELLVDGLSTYYRDAVRDLTAAASKDTDPVEMIVEMLRIAIDYLVERGAETMILHNDFDHLRRLPAFAFVVDGAAEVERIWCGAIARGIERGAFKPHLDPELTYRAIIGAIFSTSRWYDPAGPVGVDDYHRQLLTCFLTGLKTPRS